MWEFKFRIENFLATPSKALVNQIKINDDLYEIMREVKKLCRTQKYRIVRHLAKHIQASEV